MNFKVTVLSHGSKPVVSSDNSIVKKKGSTTQVISQDQKQLAINAKKSLTERFFILKVLLVYPKTSFYETFIYFHLYSKLLGLASFTVPENTKSNKIYISWFDKLAYVLFLSSSIVVLITGVYENTKETDSILLNVGIRTILFGSLVVAIPPSTLILLNRHRIWRIVQLVSSIDEQLFHLNVKVDHKSYFYRILIMVLLTSSLFFVSYAFQMYSGTDETSTWRYYIVHLYSKGCYYTFCIAAGSYYAVVHSRLVYLNQAIITNYNVHKDYAQRRIFIISHTNRSFIVRCSHIYELINQILDLVNYCFSIPLMFCLALCFVYTLFTIYSGFRMFKYEVNDKEFYFTIRNTLWNLLFVLCQLFVIVIGHKTTAVGKKTAYLAHLAIGQDTCDQELHDNFLFLSQQVRHRTPVSSCWLFTYDWTLVFSIAAALATYLIVLLQIENEISGLNIS